MWNKNLPDGSYRAICSAARGALLPPPAYFIATARLPKRGQGKKILIVRFTLISRRQSPVRLDLVRRSPARPTHGIGGSCRDLACSAGKWLLTSFRSADHKPLLTGSK
jgi:hypothetical protein